MLHFWLKKNCCLPIGVLASFLIPFRSVASDLSPPAIISFEGSVQKPYSLVTTNPFQTPSKVDSQDFLHNPKDRITARIEKRCNCAKDFQMNNGYSLSGSGFGNNALAQAESIESAEDIIQSIRNALVIQTFTGRTVTPGITVATPVGFGGFYGNVAIGGAYQAGYGGVNNNDDANIATTISLGNPKEFVSFDLTWNIYGLSDTYGSQNNFGASYLSLQLSRLLANDWSVGLGGEGIIRFEGRDASNASSYYLVTSKVFVLNEDTTKPFSVLYTSMGLGTGRFLPVENFDQYGGTGVNVFGSTAIQVIEGVNAIVEWSGQDLNAGISIAPFPNFPLIITPAVVELTNNTGNGGGRFVISASLGLFF